MDSNRNSKRKRTGSSSGDESADETVILPHPVQSGNDQIAAGSAVNSSVGQQSNSPMTQVEVDGLLQRISLEVQRLNADLSSKDLSLRTEKLANSEKVQRLTDELQRKDEEFRAAKEADSIEIERLKQELSAEKGKLVATQLEPTQKPEISVSPVGSQNNPNPTGFAANSSVGQQPNSPMDQSEVVGVLGRISLEDQRLNADLRRKYSDSPEVQHLREELRRRDEVVSQMERKLTECEAVKSGLDRTVKEQSTSIELLQMYSGQLEESLRQKDKDLLDAKRQLVDTETLKTQHFQQYTKESAKLTAVQQQFDSEKEKNRQKDQKLAKLEKELIEKSVEIHSKCGEILKLYQNAKSLRTELKLKSDENSTIKSQVKTALVEHLNCPICLQVMTEAVVTAECGRNCCKKCIDQWINLGHRRCPFCRSSKCHRSAPVVAIQQLRAKLLSCINADCRTINW